MRLTTTLFLLVALCMGVYAQAEDTTPTINPEFAATHTEAESGIVTADDWEADPDAAEAAVLTNAEATADTGNSWRNIVLAVVSTVSTLIAVALGIPAVRNHRAGQILAVVLQVYEEHIKPIVDDPHRTSADADRALVKEAEKRAPGAGAVLDKLRAGRR